MPNDESQDTMSNQSPVRFPDAEDAQSHDVEEPKILQPHGGSLSQPHTIKPVNPDVTPEPVNAQPSNYQDHSTTPVQESTTPVNTQPEQALAQAAAPAKSTNSPGVLILQWLTYAFWGWTLVALTWLTSLAVQYFVESPSNDTYSAYSSSYMDDWIAYSLAAVIVLFIISLVCDIFYSRFEPRRKTGAATVIMIIHAVIFALCGIGAVIVAVFAVVNMLISGPSDGAQSTLITALIVAALYGITLVRTLHLEKFTHATKLFWLAMLIATVTIGSMGIFGPVAQAQQTNDDRALEAALPEIASGVNTFTENNGKLPESLKDIETGGMYAESDEDVQRVIDEGLVEYKPMEKIVSKSSSSQNGLTVDSYNFSSTSSSTENPVYHYQLCATFDYEKNGGGSDMYRGDSSSYETTPSAYSHDAGKVCYDLQTGYAY